jgi:hypothetical protein
MAEEEASLSISDILRDTVGQTGRFKTVKTTPLLASEEALLAMQKARDAG